MSIGDLGNYVECYCRACPICGEEGELLIRRSPRTGRLCLNCDECQAVWDTLEELDSGKDAYWVVPDIPQPVSHRTVVQEGWGQLCRHHYISIESKPFDILCRLPWSACGLWYASMTLAFVARGELGSTETSRDLDHAIRLCAHDGDETDAIAFLRQLREDVMRMLAVPSHETDKSHDATLLSYAERARSEARRILSTPEQVALFGELP